MGMEEPIIKKEGEPDQIEQLCYCREVPGRKGEYKQADPNCERCHGTGTYMATPPPQAKPLKK